MKKHTIKFKQENILCHKCVINAAKALSKIENIREFNVDIDSKMIQVIYESDKISTEILKEVVNNSIISGKTKLILH